MKRILLTTFALAVICIGCDQKTEITAKYDMMTGEKLPEKIDHLKDVKLETAIVKAINRDYRRMLFRYEIEGHVYYSEGHSMIHSEACSCKTNNSQKTEK